MAAAEARLEGFLAEGWRGFVARVAEDIEKELKSNLEDMLEDRAEKAGRPRDEALEVELLKEYGSPQKVAATYNPHPYLIGPKLFPFFLFVFMIVITVVVSVMLVLAGIQAVGDTPFMGSDFVKIIGGSLRGGTITRAGQHAVDECSVCRG